MTINIEYTIVSEYMLEGTNQEDILEIIDTFRNQVAQIPQDAVITDDYRELKIKFQYSKEEL